MMWNETDERSLAQHRASDRGLAQLVPMWTLAWVLE